MELERYRLRRLVARQINPFPLVSCAAASREVVTHVVNALVERQLPSFVRD